MEIKVIFSFYYNEYNGGTQIDHRFCFGVNIKLIKFGQIKKGRVHPNFFWHEGHHRVFSSNIKTCKILKVGELSTEGLWLWCRPELQLATEHLED